MQSKSKIKYKNNKPFYDVVIIGGGIVGCGIMRDLSLHNISTLLLEKGDFGSQTSQSTSKMLHGGIRYLEHLEFGLVNEALVEKNLWLKMAPHLCIELPFHMPIFKDSKYSLFSLRVGLKLYDLLSHFRNSPHKILNKKETKKLFPTMNTNGLKGCGIYHDAIMDDAKLTLECLYDAILNENCEALNYYEVIEVTNKGDHSKVVAKDRLSDKIIEVYAKDVIFATGPFTDKLLTKLNIPHWDSKLKPSKGVHIWLAEDALPINVPIVQQTFDDRVIFLIPERNAILVGTTETTPEEQDFFDIKAVDEEVHYLLENLNNLFPHSKLTEKHVLSSFAGVRPLVKETGVDSHSTSREHKIFKPYHNVHVIVGGKFTTFRTMAQDIAEKIVHKNGIGYKDQLTLNPFRRKSTLNTFPTDNITHNDILEILKYEKVRTYEDLMKRRIGLPSHHHWNQGQSLNDFFAPIKSELEHNLRSHNIKLNSF